MLGTFPNNIKPSPRPPIKLPIKDAFAGGYKFVYLTVPFEIEGKSLLSRIADFIVSRPSACLLVGRFVPGRKVIDIGAVKYVEPDPILIIDAIASLAFQYSFSECYTEQKAYELLTKNQLFASYCEQKQTDTINEIRLAKENNQAYTPDKDYSFSILKINRHSDIAFRQTEYKAAYEKGLIGAMPELRQDIDFMADIEEFRNPVVCEAVGGLLLAGNKYR